VIIFDATRVVVNDMPVWPGDPPVRIEPISLPNEPAVARISLSSHAGTHVDAPAHFITGGATVESLPLATLIGPAWITEIVDGDPIDAARLEAAGIPGGTQRLLLRTRNSFVATGRDFDSNYASLAPDTAEWILRRGIRLVGIDGPSIEPFVAPGEPVHRALLGAGTVIIEGLALAGAPLGACEMICLPLPVRNGDGAPARVVLQTPGHGTKMAEDSATGADRE
jgi:arylformamidase